MFMTTITAGEISPEDGRRNRRKNDRRFLGEKAERGLRSDFRRAAKPVHARLLSLEHLARRPVSQSKSGNFQQGLPDPRAQGLLRAKKLKLICAFRKPSTEILGVLS